MTFAELEEAHKKNPDDPDLAARLADQYVRRNKAAEARKLVDAVLAKKTGHPLASVVKSRLLAARPATRTGAKAVLEDALKANPDDPRLLLAIGRLYVEAKDYDAGREGAGEGPQGRPARRRLAGATRPHLQDDERDGEADRRCCRSWWRTTRTSWTAGCGWRG